MSLARSSTQYMGVRAILPPDLQTAKRAPSSADKSYVKGTLWLDTVADAAYMWPGSGSWIALGSGTTGAIITLTGDSGGAIAPVAGNIDILGGSGVSVVGTAGTLTISLTGGGIAMDSFVPDAGTNPVVPTALGAVTMAGTANQITTTGGLNTLTFSVPATFIAPGTIASTTTLTAGSSLSVTTSAVIGTTLTATGGLTTLAALTQVGTTLINASGAATTTIGTGGTGVVNIGNATGNTAVTGSLTASTSLTATAGDITATLGHVIINGAAKQLRVHGGAATDFIGTAVLTNGTVTVANTNIATTDRIFVQRSAVNASSALGVFKVVKTAATNFVITACKPADATTETGDASTVEYFIVRQV